jgi:hypothetical protein
MYFNDILQDTGKLLVVPGTIHVIIRIIFNATAAAIQKWWKFKLLRWVQNLHQSM